MKILVATKAHAVFDALSQAREVEVVSALDTGRMYGALPGTQLAIVDFGDLIAHPFSVSLIRQLLEAMPRLKLCSSADFIADPQQYLEARSLRRSRALRLPEKRVIAFTSYSGGTGKTSLALDTATHFVRRVREVLPLPTAVFEFTFGNSAFQALLGDEQPALYQLINEPDHEAQTIQGVTLYPMDSEGVRLLSSDRVGRYVREQMSHHVLSVIDTIWPYGMLSSIEAEVDLWVVVTTPRVDAVENARKLRAELERDFGEERVITAVNQYGGLMDSLALAGTQKEIEMPRLQQSELFFQGRLGREVLNYVYPDLWPDYERLGRRRLFRLRRGA